MDDAIGHLMSGLTERNLDKHVHLVVVSLGDLIRFPSWIQLTSFFRSVIMAWQHRTNPD